jgi:hypothetical protein
MVWTLKPLPFHLLYSGLLIRHGFDKGVVVRRRNLRRSTAFGSVVESLRGWNLFNGQKCLQHQLFALHFVNRWSWVERMPSARRCP